MPRANVLVTGRPDVGKTTLIRRVLDELMVDTGGFYTHEIRDGGKRVGFAITDLAGPSGILAHIDIRGPYRVGKYGVNRDDLERIGVQAVREAISGSELIVLDEIGGMELCSEEFMEAVVSALDSAKPVLGTIQARRNAFLDAVRAREDVEVIRVTEKNRDEMASVVLSKISRLLAA